MTISFTFLLGVILMLNSTVLKSVEVEISVTGIETERGGNIIVFIFSDNGFPIKHEKAILNQKKEALSSVMLFKFNVELDEMAVKILHDENGDGKTSKNWTGIYPKEGLGFSNKQKLSLTGPPRYKKSKLAKKTFENGLTIPIIYP